MTEPIAPISDEKLADLRFWAEPIPGRSPDRDSRALTRKTMRSLLARLDAAEAEVERLREALRRIDRHTNGSHERRRHFVANEIARSALTEGAPDD